MIPGSGIILSAENFKTNLAHVIQKFDLSDVSFAVQFIYCNVSDQMYIKTGRRLRTL